jgi:predicted CXXCH cytochrome family protein
MTSLRVLNAGAAFVFLFALLPAAAVEHPGSLDKDADCTSCHSAKMRGKSVHSAMQSPCNVCHVTTTQGDMMLVSLSMPKNKICFACHEQASALRLHNPSVKRQCMECHDAHSSDRRMLLRDEGGPPLSALRK